MYKEVKDTTPLFASKSYLIIDDFQGMRTMMREMLRTFGGKNIDTATNAAEAIPLMEKNRYDVVLCDYNLGSGKNGLQILEEVKHRNLIGLATAWIIITAEKTSDLVFGAAEHMPDDYIIKPVNESTMKGRLEKVLAKKEVLVNVEKAVRAKHHPLTVALCDKLLASTQTNTVELLRIKTSTLMTMGQHDQAEQVFNQILAKRDIPWAKTGLGKVAFLKGDMERAQQLFNEVIRDNPAYLEAHDWLVKTHESMGNLDEAQNVLARSVELSPTSVLRQRNLGEMAQKRGDLETAANAFRRTIKLGEHSIHKAPSTYLNLARVCSDKGTPAEALQVLKNVTQEFEGAEIRLHAKVMEGSVYNKSGDHINSQKMSKELAAITSSHNTNLPPELMLEATQLFLATGNKEAAGNMAKSLVKNNHENAELLTQVSELYNKAGMHDIGDELVNKSREEVIESNNRAVVMAKEGKLEEAIQLLREARVLLPNNKRIMINLANVSVLSMRQNGMNDELFKIAKDCMMRVAAIDPKEKWPAQIKAALDALAPQGNV
ncbi:MAG TPA: tetratricopeptide repeat protein [Gallionella sp.]|nr:tetratricopeptide repeat protein [Gallionella sp.]